MGGHLSSRISAQRPDSAGVGVQWELGPGLGSGLRRGRRAADGGSLGLGAQSRKIEGWPVQPPPLTFFSVTPIQKGCCSQPPSRTS